MQIHELNNFVGSLDSGAYVAVDNGTDTGKTPVTAITNELGTRVDNLISNIGPSEVTTLWTGTMASSGDSATLSDDVANYDYVDIYVSDTDYQFIRRNTSFINSPILIQAQKVTNSAALNLYRTRLAISGTSASITEVINWHFDGGASYAKPDVYTSEAGPSITRIDGVKVYDSSSIPEIADARIGADGITYPTLGDAIREPVSNLKRNIGDFLYSQTKKARLMVVSQGVTVGDRLYFKLVTWSGASWSQCTVQGLYNGAYTTLVRATAIGQEFFFVADKAYESFVISVGVSAVPTTNVTLEFILCNLSNTNNIAGRVMSDYYNSFRNRGYIPQNGDLNSITDLGYYLLAASRISTISGLPDDITADSVVSVYPGALTLQTIRELSYPYRFYQRYLYNNNQSQSVWIRKVQNTRARKAYLFGDSLTKGVLGTGGTGNSYLAIAATMAGYDVVNCGIGGIGYVYSAKKTVDEVPWNTGEGRIRAQDVINHYASELSNANTVILAYGVNDWQTLGDPNTTIAEADRRATSSNMTANVKTIIETIMAANKNVRIIVVTPINTAYRGGSVATGYALETALDNNGDGREAMTLEKIYQAIVDACDYYGVSYIDMTHNNQTINYLNITATSVLPDRLHPSQTTYFNLADSINIK